MAENSGGHDLTSLHISVASSPSAGLSLKNELPLLKTALLYADRATLCSPVAILLLGLEEIMKLGEEDQIAFVTNVVPSLLGRTPQVAAVLGSLQQYVSLRKRLIRTRGQEKDVRRIRGILRDSFERFAASIEEMLQGANINPLRTAIHSGLLTIHQLPMDSDLDKAVQGYVQYVIDSLKTHGTLPLFDHGTGQLAGAAIRAGMVELSTVRALEGKSAPIAATLFERLPLFEAATIDEILDIRKELQSHLARFRAAILRLADDIRSMPWDKNFQNEAALLITRDIAPVIEDIHAEIRANNYLMGIMMRLIGKPTDVAQTSVLGILFSQLGDMPAVTAAAFGATIGVGTQLAVAYNDWRAKQSAIERNQLYFYYRLGTRLR